MAEKLTAAQRRYIENALLIAALGLIFKQLSENYKSKKLGEIAETTSGGTPLRNISTYYDGDIPWIKSGELNDGIILEAEEFITQEGLENSSAKIYPKGTLVVALYGATVGKTGILGLDAASNQAVCAVFPKEDVVTTEFLFWFLRHKRPDFLGSSFGGAQPNISQKLLRDTELPIPPKSLQQLICNFMKVVEQRQNGDKSVDYPTLPDDFAKTRRIVARIEALAARVAEAQSLRREASEEATALYHSALASAIPWTAKTHFLVDLIAPGIKMSYGVLVPGADLDEGVPFVRVQDLDLHNPNLKPNKKIAPEISAQYKRTLLQGGEVLIGVVGSIGKVGIAPQSWAGANIARAVCRIVPNYQVDPKYLAYVLQSSPSQQYFFEATRTLAQPTLNVGQLEKTPIPVPLLEEQRRLVAYLDGLQAQVSALRAAQAETERELSALLPSVLDRAFSGRL